MKPFRATSLFLILFFLVLALVLALNPDRAIAQTGSLRVTITPDAANDAGARWRLAKSASNQPSDDYPWRRSGDTEIDIPVGSYLIEFEEVDGWMRPENQVVQIEANETKQETGIYQQPPEEGGSLQVVIEPLAAREAGAQWRVVGTTEWLESGATVRGLVPGTQTIEYSGISGWTRPPAEDVVVKARETYFAIGTYTQAPSQLGRLIVNIQPDGARFMGAQWALRTEGFTDFRNSGDILIDIPAGDHILTFSDVQGWTKPADRVVTISAAPPPTTVNVMYQDASQVGRLIVNILPDEAKLAGAQWALRTEGFTDFRNSGDILIDIPVGDHILTFSDVQGWTKPADRVVTISAEQTRTTSATYSEVPVFAGQIQVIISPPLVNDVGARWRLVMEPERDWRTSGDIELNIPFGTYIVEFEEVVGWAKPSTLPVTIDSADLAVLRATYEQGGTLHVYIEPQAAKEQGAGWRIAGRIPDEEDAESGWYTADLTTLDGLRPGQHTIEFNAIPGWLKPDSQTVTIEAGSTTFANGMYILDTEETFLRVLIEPLTAYYQGARWRRVGTQTWRHSGEQERGLPEGTYTVEFNPVAGYDTPGNKAVNLFRGRNNANITGFYSGNEQRGLTHSQWLLAFYAAYWGRAADPAGLNYWLAQINDGLSVADAAENFALSQEAINQYPYFRTVQDGIAPKDEDIKSFVHAVYQNLFQRAPDSTGEEYWAHVLRTGASTPGAFIGNVANAALQLGSTDWMTVSNKIHVAEHFLWRFGNLGRSFQDSDLTLAKGALSDVTSDPSTVISAKNSIDHLLWP